MDFHEYAHENAYFHYNNINSQTIEEFGLNICEHFITSFNHVVYCNAFIQEVPWQRLEKDGIPHVHAFLYSSEGVRFCEVERTAESAPIVFSGIKDLKLMKTTQSGFQGFFKDKYTTLPERGDRVLSVETLVKWCYNDCSKDLDYDCICSHQQICVQEKCAFAHFCAEAFGHIGKLELITLPISSINAIMITSTKLRRETKEWSQMSKPCECLKLHNSQFHI
uniref:Uricase n=1 Tax=Varanus komodoensis TaxID=61221 RepID=A0A8D2JIS1_VARKO